MNLTRPIIRPNRYFRRLIPEPRSIPDRRGLNHVPTQAMEVKDAPNAHPALIAGCQERAGPGERCQNRIAWLSRAAVLFATSFKGSSLRWA